ncbi:MAG: hypothetical protein K2O85_01450, partial [Helicobacter sp.]|nr:hypothetical protein [Helicobacter sp.]
TSPNTGGFSNTTAGDYTATAYKPATEAIEQIGTKAEVTGGELKWLPTDIRAGSMTEILKVVIGGDTYTIEGTAKADNAGGVGLTTANIKTILSNTSSTGNVTDPSSDVLDYVVKFNGVQAANGIGTLLAAAKVKVDDSVPNKIKIVEDAGYSGDGSTISITTGRGAAQSQSATWTLTKEAGVPAQSETSTFTIAKSVGENIAIGITGAGLTDVQVADAVYALLTTGKIPDGFSGEVTINGAAYAPGNASTLKALFTLPAGLTYTHTNGTNKIDIDSSGLDSTYAENLSITFSQDGAEDVQGYQITGASGQDFGRIVVDFGNGLLAGQSYTFNGKTIIATKNLSGEDVANAFTYDAGDSFDGAVIVSDFDNTQINNDVGWSIEGSKLTIIGTSTSSIGDAASDTVTGTGALATNTNRVSGETIVQGSDGRGQHADSYVEFSTANLGGSGAAANIVANTSALDSISNFDASNDSLRLRDSLGNIYTEASVQRGDLYAGAIYVDSAGSTLAASATNGIISFNAVNASGATTSTDSITLDQKLYVATHAMANNKVAGFAHGGDFYVIATGSNANSTADDLVIKLAGIAEGSIGNIANILA